MNGAGVSQGFMSFDRLGYSQWKQRETFSVYSPIFVCICILSNKNMTRDEDAYYIHNHIYV